MTDPNKVTIRKRLGGILIDHIIFGFTAIFLRGFGHWPVLGELEYEHTGINAGINYLILLAVVFYFLKDSIDGRSIGKFFAGIQVIDSRTGQAAGPFQCFLRNLSCLIWPIEAIALLIDPEKRLGDKLARTKVVNKHPELDKLKINYWQILFLFIVFYGLMIVTLNPVLLKMRRPDVGYNENSLNLKKSKELEKLLADSLGQYYRPDIRIYDKTKTPGLTYISGVMKVRSAYFTDKGIDPLNDKGVDPELGNSTLNLIYSKYPKEKLTGKIKYVTKNGSLYWKYTYGIGINEVGR